MRKSEIEVFADVYEMRDWIRKMEDKGYEVVQLNNFNSSILVLMQKDEAEKKEKTKKHQPKKTERLIALAIESVELECLKKPEYWAELFIKHRRAIKKSIKTEAPLKSFLKELDKICQHGLDVAKAVEKMQEREWQTLKLEYIANLDNEVEFM